MQGNTLCVKEMGDCRANRYELHAPGIESQCGQDFPQPF
jgi:hypothetical protein